MCDLPFVQSVIGNVAAGSLFASLQSAGAAGISATTTVLVSGAAGTVGGATGVGGTWLGGRLYRRFW